MSEHNEQAVKAENGSAVIRHSLIWAAVMIAVALQVSGKPGAQGIQMTLLAGWFASFSVLGGLSREGVAAECAWFRRVLRRDR
jgi:hypothetical protein